MEMVVETPVAHEDRRHTAQRIATEMFHQQPDWVTFFREVLGVDGLLRRLFPKPEELANFEKTEEYSEIQLMPGIPMSINTISGANATDCSIASCPL